MLQKLIRQKYSITVSTDVARLVHDKIDEYIFLMNHWYNNALDVYPEGDEWDENHIVQIRAKKVNSIEYWLLMQALVELRKKIRTAYDKAYDDCEPTLNLTVTHLERHLIDTEKLIQGGFQTLIESAKSADWDKFVDNAKRIL